MLTFEGFVPNSYDCTMKAVNEPEDTKRLLKIGFKYIIEKRDRLF